MALSLPEDLGIGIQELDDQHRALYAEINRLHDAMKANELEKVLPTADYLVKYANEHFAAEEKLMIEAGYPGFPAHLAHHAAFKHDLERWRSRLAKDGPTPSLVVELSSWLANWLRDHIRKVDAQMAKFLRARALKS